MSVLYGFDLIVPKTGLGAVLDALARRADSEGFRGCTIQIPGHAPVQVPFDGDSENGPVDLLDVGRPEPATWLEANLWLPVDDPVREYLAPTGRDTERRIVRQREEASIGLVSIFLHAGERFGIVALGAATSSMSYMFEGSGAVRSTVLTILDEVGGLAALLSRQPGEPYEFLDRPGSSAHVDPYDTGNAGSVDRFAENVPSMRPVMVGR
jgi:hypothetical protein